VKFVRTSDQMEDNVT